MPANYAFGQHPALLQAHAAPTPGGVGEDPNARLDDSVEAPVGADARSFLRASASSLPTLAKRTQAYR